MKKWFYIPIAVCVILAVACGMLYQGWRDEQSARRLYEALSEYYQNLYYDSQADP